MTDKSEGMSTVRRLKAVQKAPAEEPVQLEQEFAALLRFKDALERKNQVLDQRVFELNALLQAGKGLSRIRDFHSMVQTIEAMLIERFSVSEVWIWLRSESGSSLQCVNPWVQNSLMPSAVPAICTPDQGWFWLMVREGKIFSVKDLAGNHRFSKVFNELGWDRLPASLCVPLIQAGEVFGVILLGHSDRDWTSEEKTFLEEFAAILTLNLDLILQYEQNQVMLVKALTDRMTGLWNNRCYEEDIEKILSQCRSKEEPCAVIVSDIDHFKKFNDTHGHAAGDAVLKFTAQLYQEWVGMHLKEGKVYRYGGEEFVIVLPAITSEKAFQIAEGLRKKLELSEIHFDEKVLKVTASMGIAEFPVSAQDSESLFKRADEALYEAKKQGRNQVQVQNRLGGSKRT